MTLRIFLLFLIGMAPVFGAPNDHFQNPTNLGVEAKVTVLVQPIGATRQSGEPSHDRNDDDGSLWWTWTAPSEGTLTLVPTRGQEVALYRGTNFENLAELRADYDFIEIEEAGSFFIAAAGDREFEFTLDFTPTPSAPANDNFADREVIEPWSTPSFTYTGTTLKATREANEPVLSFQPDRERSIWLEWTAPSSGLFTIETSGGADLLGIYSGESFATLVKRDDNRGRLGEMRVLAEETLVLQLVDTYWGEGRETSAEMTFVQAVNNERFEQAIDLGSAYPLSVEADLRGTVYWQDDGTIYFGKNGWWIWTAPANGVLEVSSDPSFPELRLRDFYFLKNGNPVAFPRSAKEGGFGFGSSFAQVHAGDGVLIRMGGNNAENGDQFLLDFHQAVANDNFADAIDLGSESSVTVSVERGPATSEPGFPDAGSQRWWIWTAPATGRISISPGVSTYAGNSFGSLTQLASNSVSRDQVVQVYEGSEIRFATYSGTYRDNGDSFSFEFLPFDGSNDDLEDAKVLPSERYFNLGALLSNATIEPGEPDPIPWNGGSRWWVWTSPVDGFGYLKVKNFSAYISAFRRIDGQLTEVSDTMPSTDKAGFSISAGERYWFRVEESVGRSSWGEFTFGAFPDRSGPDRLAEALDFGQETFWQGDFALRQATLEENEPVFFENGIRQNSGSLWFTWTAPEAGELTINSDSLLGYVGIFSSQPFLSQQGEQFLSQTGRSKILVEAGKKYWMGLFKMSETVDPGMVTLSLELETPHPLTRAENAIDLGSDWEVKSSTPWIGRTAPSREVIWLKWTAPDDGAITLSDTAVISTGDSENELQPLGEGARLSVKSGGIYYFRVPIFSSEAYRFGKIEFEISGAPAPANDDFSDAEMVAGNAELTFDLTGASSEPNEVPEVISTSWYRWVASQSGKLKVSFEVLGGSRFPFTRMTGYAGDSLESLVNFGEASNSWGGPSFSLNVGPGESIYVQLASDYSNFGSLAFEFSPTVANDSRFSPQDLPGEARVEFSPDNTRASRHPNEWDGNLGGRPTTWYRWVAPRDGLLTVFRDEGSISLHEADGGPSDEPLLIVSGWPGRVAVSGGKSYLLRYESSNEVSNKVFLALESIPSHSFVDTPKELPSVENTLIEGDFTGAIADESVSYDDLSFSPSYLLWYSWTAPRSGPFVINRISEYPTVAIWKSRDAGPPVLLSEGNNHWVAFEAVAGESYLFSAFSGRASPPAFQCQLSPLDPATNDDFADRVVLDPTASWSVSATNYLATREENEPTHNGELAEASLWYSWTAPMNGDFLIDSLESEIRVGVSVFEGNPFGDHTRIVERQRRGVFRAVGGQTYEISVDQFEQNPIDRGRITLTLDLAQRPPNDDFPSRTIITSPRPIFNGDLKFATLEPDEPMESGFRTPASSVWFEWTAPSNQSMYQGSRSLNFFTSTAPNPTLSDLERMDWRIGTPNRVSARSGVTYYVQVSSLRILPIDNLVLDPSNSEPFSTELVPNDVFEDRIVLPSETIIRTGLDGAGLEQDDREPGFLSSYYSGWWSWTAPESGYYLIESHSFGSRFSFVFTGDSLESLSEVASGSGNVRFFAEAGTSYQIASAIRWRSSGSLFRRDWIGFELRKIVVGPDNDNFADALVLDPSLTQTFYQQNFLATTEADEPNPTAIPASNSVWSKWSPERSGDIVIESSVAESILGVYTGSSLTNLELVTSGIGRVELEVQGGTSYYLVADSVESVSFSLEIFSSVNAEPSENDDFADAVVWTGSHHASEVDAAAFLFEDFEPYPAGASDSWGSSWWKWTAPESGITSIKLNGQQLHLSIYQGTDFTNLQILASTDYLYLPINFSVEQGVTYFVQVINSSRSSGSEFRLSLDQRPDSLANDSFANATPLSGSAFSRTVQTDGSSFETGEPLPYGASVWFSWIVPQDGLYQLTTDYGYFRIFLGTELTSLSHRVSGNREVQARFSAGEEIRISLTATDDREVKIAMKPLTEIANDRFENRIDLGAARTVSLRHSLQYSSLEPDDPFYDLINEKAGTAWWSWTAPQDGLASLSHGHRVFTGDTLETLVPLDNKSSTVRFIAEQGVIYHFAGYTYDPDKQSNEDLSLSVEVIANDDFADRIVIPGELPFTWEGTLVNATFETGEAQGSGGSAWWEWTATFDGEIIFPSDTTGLDFYTGYPSRVTLDRVLPSSDSPYAVRKGETYYFRLTGASFKSRILHFEKAPEPSEFSNTIADTATLFTFPINPVQAYVGLDGPIFLWYSWIADQDGTLTVESPQNQLGFSEGSDAADLKTLIPHHNDRRSIQVHSGIHYWIRVKATSAKEFDFSFSLGPVGDMFDDAPALPSQSEIQWLGATTGSGWEFGEPRIFNRVPQRTIWRTWIAPISGKYRFSLDQFYAGIARGDQLETLDFLDEGRSGIFDAIAGESYRIVVGSGFEQGDFRFVIAPVDDLYETWRSKYFNETDEAGIASSDPDRDGRSNLVEMALGSDPKLFDGPIQMWMEEVEGDLVLSVLRPMGIKGVTYSFDLTLDMAGWQETLDLAHETRTEPSENGMEIFQVILKNSPYLEAQKVFVRLRAKTISRQ